MNIKSLSDALGLEEEEFLELLVLFADTGQADLARMETGLSEGNADQVMRSAHTLKGASGNLGLTDISALAHVIEQHALNHRLEAAGRVFQDLKSRFEAMQSVA